jgi:hypothetical protein
MFVISKSDRGKCPVLPAGTATPGWGSGDVPHPAPQHEEPVLPTELRTVLSNFDTSIRREKDSHELFDPILLIVEIDAYKEKGGRVLCLSRSPGLPRLGADTTGPEAGAPPQGSERLRASNPALVTL